MCLHPEIVKKAQLELDSVLEGKRLPVIEDRPSLPYVTAIAKEAMRWHPVLPMGEPSVNKYQTFPLKFIRRCSAHDHR
jgi:cytochrome P450